MNQIATIAGREVISLEQVRHETAQRKRQHEDHCRRMTLAALMRAKSELSAALAYSIELDDLGMDCQVELRMVQGRVEQLLGRVGG